MLFNIKIYYFKPSGKFYSEANIIHEFTNCGTNEHPICYMNDVIDWIKESPGLINKWDGPILVLRRLSPFNLTQVK